MESLLADQLVHVHAEHLGYIGHACVKLLMNWKALYGNNSVSFSVQGDSLPRNLKAAEKVRACFTGVRVDLSATCYQEAGIKHGP